MNKVMLIGRLTKEPEYKHSNNDKAVTTYTLAVDRRFNSNDEQTADFIRCVAFGTSAEFANKYFHKGTKIGITGRLNTGSYTDQNGNRVYTTDVIIESQEFVESKKNQSTNNTYNSQMQSNNY